jgi:hypothetical protein
LLTVLFIIYDHNQSKGCYNKKIWKLSRN